LEKGQIQIYTGDGKGKTTAALGLALRAAGAGFKVFIGQFVKGMHYSELDSLKRFDDLITVKQYGRGCFIKNKPVPEDVKAARIGLEEIGTILESGDYRVVILDEANIAIYFNLFTEDELISCLKKRASQVEVIITGRKASQALIDMADLVTEMKEIKHYYQKGLQARLGMEK